MKAGLLALLFLPAMAAPPAALVRSAPPAAGPVSPAETPAAADPLDALVADSPFGAPAGGGRNVTPGATGPLELRGIVLVDDAYQFSIYDQSSGKADWVKIGERGFPFVARSFNQERDALTVDHQGRTLVLALQAAKTGTAGGNAPPASPSPLPGPARNGGGPASGGPAGNNPGNPSGGPGNSNANAGAGPAPPPSTANPNGSEAQRLQNLADEIRRRRGSGPQLVLPKRN